MLSLLVSALVHTTTAAMTVMPFLLIFQLAFSGGFFTLPEWAQKVSPVTISNPGMTAIAALSDYNNQPMSMGWKTIDKIQDDPIEGEITVGQLMKLFGGISENVLSENEDLKEVPELLQQLADSEEVQDTSVHYSFTLRKIIDAFGQDRVKEGVDAITSATAYNELYARSEDTVRDVWLKLGCYAALYALIAMIALEFIDKDKR